MSLVSTYVKMPNKMWYQNPIIYDKTLDWFICFDDDDPPELVLKSPKQISKIERVEYIKNTLFIADISVEGFTHSVSGNRLFPPEWKKFHPAVNAFLKINGFNNLEILTIKYDKALLDRPEGQGVYYEF